jgi:hypothetical protein
VFDVIKISRTSSSLSTYFYSLLGKKITAVPMRRPTIIIVIVTAYNLISTSLFYSSAKNSSPVGSTARITSLLDKWLVIWNSEHLHLLVIQLL